MEDKKIFPGPKLTCESYGDLGRLSEINKVEVIPVSSLVPRAERLGGDCT